MLRRLGRIVRYLALALLSVLLILYGTILNPLYEPWRDALLPQATRLVSSALNGSVEIGAVRGSLLSAPVLHNITLRDATGNLVGHIDTIRLAYGLVASWPWRLEVQAVEIVRPQIMIVQQSDGRLNLQTLLPESPAPTPQQPGSGGLPFAIRLHTLHIRDGDITLDVPALPGVRQIAGVQIRLSAQVDQTGWRAEVQQMTATASPAEFTLQTLQGTVHSQDGVLRVDGVRVQTGASLITAQGTLPGSSLPADFRLHVQPLDLAEIGRLLHNDLLRDPVQVTLTAAGPPEAVQVQAQLSTPAASLSLHGQVDTAAMSPAYQARLHVSHLDLAGLTGQAEWHSDINLTFNIAGQGRTPSDLQGHVQVDIQPSHLGSILLRPSAIHLEAAQQRLQIQHLDLDTSVAQMTASGALDLAGTSDVRYALRADLAGLHKLVGTQELAGQVQLQGQAQGTWPELGIGGTLKASALRYHEHRLETLQLTYAGAQLGSDPQASVRLLAQQAQVSTLPIERASLDVTYQGAARQAQFTLDVKQAPGNGGKTSGTLTLGDTAQQVVVEEFLLQLPQRPWRSPAPWRVVVGPQQVRLENIRLVHAEESLSLSGAMLGEHFQDVQLRVAQLDLSYLQQFLQLPPTVGGRASGQMQLTGTLAEPRLQSAWTLGAPTPQTLPFESLQSTLEYAQQRLQGGLQIKQANREVLALELRLPLNMALTDLTLAQRLLDAPVDVRLSLQQPDLAAIQQAYPALPKLHGTLQGSMHLQGSYASLGLQADMQLQNLSAQGHVEQLSGPLHLSGTVVSAPSVTALAQAIQHGQMTPQLQNIILKAPAIQGQLPSPGAPAQPFQVQDLHGQASAQWTPQGVSATLQRLQLHTTGFNMPPTAMTLEAKLEPQGLTIKQLQLRLPQSELQAHGVVTLPEQQLQLRFDLPRLRLDEFPLTLPAHFPPLVQGTLALRGSVQAPQVEADLQYAGGRLRADLSGQLQELVPRYQATLRLDGVDMAQLLPQAQGRLQGSVRLQGSGLAADKRQATLEMTVDSNDLNLAPGLAVRLQARVIGDTVQVPRLQVRSTPVDITANGTLSTTQQTAFDYRLTLGDLRPLGRYLGMELQAKGELSGKVQGNNGVLQTQARLQGNDWHIGEVYIQRLLADFAATQLLTAPRATLKAQIQDVQSPTLLPTSLRLEFARTAQQGNFTIAVTKGPYDKSTLVGILLPSAQSQRFTLNTVRLHHQQLAWENASPIDIVHFASGQVQVERLRMRSGTQELTAQGNLAADGALQAEMHIRQVQIRPTVQAFAPTADVPDGRLHLNAVVRGTVQQPLIQGDVQVSALQWQQHKLGDIRATLEHNGAVVRTDLRWQEQERQLLRVYGSMGLGTSAPLDVRVEAADFDLARVATLTAAVQQSAGVLGMALHVTGTAQKPQFEGQIALRDGVLQLAAVGERYKNIQARLRFARERLEIEQFQIGSSTGPLQLSGSVEHTALALRQLDLAVRAQNFTAVQTPTMQAVISADIQARGPHDALVVQGKVSVPRARLVTKGLPGSGPKIVEPWELTVEGVYGRRRQNITTVDGKEASPTDPAAMLSSLQADVRIDIPRNAWVQGPGTAVEMRGDLRVTKARNEPFIVSGAVETVRGFASFYGKKFDITQGQVAFTGTPEINPQLDVTVTRKVSDYVVTIHTGGKALQPEIEMSSVPPLEQADILSLLVVGKTTDKLTNSEQGSFSQQAQQIVGGLVASELEGVLGDTLGLDSIELTAESAHVGRYVTQDLFLSYERGLGSKDSGNTVGAEYSISRRMKLKGTSSDKGETAIDLFWRLDY